MHEDRLTPLTAYVWTVGGAMTKTYTLHTERPQPNPHATPITIMSIQGIILYISIHNSLLTIACSIYAPKTAPKLIFLL